MGKTKYVLFIFNLEQIKSFEYNNYLSGYNYIINPRTVCLKAFFCISGCLEEFSRLARPCILCLFYDLIVDSETQCRIAPAGNYERTFGYDSEQEGVEEHNHHSTK